MNEQEWLTNEDPAAMLSHLQWEVSRTRHYQSDDYSTSRSRRNLPLITDRQLKLWVEACYQRCGIKNYEVERGLRDGFPNSWTDIAMGWASSTTPLPFEKAVLLRDIVNPFPRTEYKWAPHYDRPFNEDKINLILYELKSRVMTPQKVGSPYRDEEWLAVEWLTETVQQIAVGIYGGQKCERCGASGFLDQTGVWESPPKCPDCRCTGKTPFDPSGYGPLHDALEEAGCTDEVILHHLRGEEPVLRPIQRMTQVVGPDLVRPVGWRPLQGPHVRGCWVIDLILGHQ